MYLCTGTLANSQRKEVDRFDLVSGLGWSPAVNESLAPIFWANLVALLSEATGCPKLALVSLKFLGNQKLVRERVAPGQLFFTLDHHDRCFDVYSAETAKNMVEQRDLFCRCPSRSVGWCHHTTSMASEDSDFGVDCGRMSSSVVRVSPLALNPGMPFITCQV